MRKKKKSDRFLVLIAAEIIPVMCPRDTTSEFLIRAEMLLGEPVVPALCELGEELGISDLYTQKEILERYRSRVQQMEAEQRETSRKKIRLYQSMGLLAGMAVAILLC